MSEEAPQYFALMCTRFLGTSQTLAKELWQAYVTLDPEKARSVHYALDKLSPQEKAPAAIVRQRLRHTSTLLTPVDMFQATLALSAEGSKRRRDIVELEESILRYVNKDGEWK